MIPQKQRLLFLKISFVAIAILVFIQLAIVGFLLFKSDYLKAQVINQLTILTGKKVTIDKFEFTLTTKGLVFQSSDLKFNEKRQIKNIEVEFNLLSSLLSQKLDASNIKIDYLMLDFSQKSQFDIKDFLNFEYIHLSNTQVILDKKYALKNIDIYYDNDIFTLKSQQQNLPLSSFFSKNLPPLDIFLKFNSKTQNIQGALENQEIKLNFDAKITNTATKSIDFKSTIQYFDLTKTQNYLPNKIMDESLVSWLSLAFQKGQTKNTTISFKTPLEKTWQKALDKAKFNAKIPLIKTQLFFHEDWQTLNNMNGFVIIEDENLIVKADIELAKLKLKKAWVNIPDLFADFPVVEVSGSFNIESRDGMDFLHSNTVIEKEVGQFVSSINIQGPTTSSIYLNIPISPEDNTPIGTDLKIEFVNSTVTIQGAPRTINKVTGELLVQNQNLMAKGKANIMDYPLTWTLTQGATSALKINIQNPTVTINLVNKNNSWYVKIDNADLSGNVVFANDFKKTPWLIDIEKLNLDAFIGETSTTMTLEPFDIFPSKITVQNIIYKQNKIVQFKLDIKKPVKSEVDFSGQLMDEKIQSSFYGTWREDYSEINLDIDTKKLNYIFNKLDIPIKHKNGKTKIEAKLSCPCGILKANLKNIQGSIKAEMMNGSFLEKGHFLGGVLSLLNIKALAKRLTFDGSDISAEDFIYDVVKASLTLKNGKLVSNKTEVLSPSSYIVITGKTDLFKKTYQFDARVNPDISSTIPIITYLTGGGLVGLGVWIFDEIFFNGQMLNDGLSAFYTIRGPWDKPIVK